MEGKGQIDPKTWKGIRSVMQVQLMVAFVVAVLMLKQWWFCALMIALGGLLSAFHGRIWCGLLCPNGGFIDLIWSKISLRLLPFPRWLNKGRVLQSAFLIGMIGYFAWIVWLVNVHKGLPIAYASYAQHGYLFLRFCQVMLALAAGLAIVFEPRTFCAHLCPGGTIGTIAAALTKRSPIVMDAEKCAGCRVCTSVCDAPDRLLVPLIEKSQTLQAQGKKEKLPISPECYGCLDCVAICPKGALRVETLNASETEGVPLKEAQQQQ